MPISSRVIDQENFFLFDTLPHQNKVTTKKIAWRSSEMLPYITIKKLAPTNDTLKSDTLS